MSEAIADSGVSTPALSLTPAAEVVATPALRPRAPRFEQRFLLDVATLVSASAVNSILWGRLSAMWVVWQGVFLVLVLANFAARGAYGRRLRFELVEDMRGIVTGTAAAAMATLTAQLVLDRGSASTEGMARQWAFAAVYLFGVRAGVRLSAARSARRGESGSPTLIVGAGKVGRTIADRFRAQQSVGLTPIGFLDKEPLDGIVDGDLPVLGASWDLEDVVRAHRVEHVVIAFSTAPTNVVLDIVRRCDRLGVTVSYVPRLFESVNGNLELEHFGGIPLLTRKAVNPRDWRFLFKYACERLIAAVILVAFLPVFALLAAAVWLSVGSPVLFRQTRIGRDGKPFEMFKFRSMLSVDQPVDDALPTGPDTAPGGVEGVDRRTALGTFMRRNSLDELPQLLNVLKGDMSLVGPRPERPRFVEMFEENVYRYADRHRVKVGITGWAQIHGLRGKTSLADRVEWDNYYIENWTPWLDLKTLLLTFGALFRGREAVE